ncbi:hypothetical protein [Neolewinella litorea]|uniref:Uncharacterized protein n=1 Tax=Neolewinella litorea TaxID=2562452 RepID=A0A4S4NAX0_9BACT|nr:hypothetical protein [Neolewinella litorea]THH36492.1 hypothetical protein E4021_14590 [Neolewinella litorea]
MIARWILWLGLLWLAHPVGAQAPGGVTDFFLDPVGKPYFLLQDDRLVTGNQLGANTYSFYDSSLGSPDYVDVTNPFQILVYYREYGTVVVLDRTLSELDRIDLFAIQDIQQPGAIARSYDNGIWVFDNWGYRLLRLDENGRIDQQTNNLRLQLGIATPAGAIFVDRNAVMLHFPEEGRLAVFTNYGKFRYWVAIPPADELSWSAPRLLGLSAGGDAWLWTPKQREVRPLEPVPTQLLSANRILPGPDGLLTVRPGSLEIERWEFKQKK